MTGEIIHQRGLHNVLLVGLKTNLRSTWEKFLSAHLPLYTIFFDWIAYRDHQRAFHKKNGRYDHCILLINYEALGKKVTKSKKLVDRFNDFGFDMVIYDEVQKNKARNSANSRYARRLRNVPYRLGLSGTPMDATPNDLWAVMRFIDYRVLGLQWGEYSRFFTKPAGYMGYKRKFNVRLHDVYVARIKPFVYRVTKQEAGIEPAVVKYVPVEMGRYQQRKYDELEADMMVDVRGEIITTPLKIVQIGKLQQITGGYLIDEEQELHRIGRAKQERLEQLLDKYDGPLVIFCKYSHEVEECRKVASKYFHRVEVLTGKVKDKLYKRKPDSLRRTKLLEAFQRGEIDVLVAQQRTGGVGVDMYRARLAIVYSCNHSFIDFDQMTSRLDFMGQTEQAKFLVLYVPNTIDADIRSAIKLKTSVTTATLNRLRRKGLHNGQGQKESPRKRFAGSEG
jgi:superfamily II DNA or RNA helicase